MSEEIPTMIPATEPAPEPVAPLSITDKFVGILTEPEATYTNLKTAGHKVSDWLIPTLIFTIVIAIGTYFRMTNPEFVERMRQEQQTRMEEMVKEGKMTQEQASRSNQQLENIGPMIAIFSVVGVLFTVPLFIIVLGLIYWLILKFLFKGKSGFGLALAAYGLAAYFGAIDQLISLLLALVTNNMFASLSPALLLTPDPHAMTFKILNALNPIQIWSMIVLGIGLARVHELPRAKTYGLVFGLWALWVIGSLFVKLPGGMGM